MARILVIEDEMTLRVTVRRGLELSGHEAAEASTVSEAKSILREREFDAVLADVNLGGESSLGLVRSMRAEGYEGVIVVLTAYGTVDNAVEAMKAGADDYLQKPVGIEELAMLVDRSLQNRRTLSRLRLYQRLERVRSVGEGDLAMGESEAWRRALRLAERFAELPIPKEVGVAGPLGGVSLDLPTILLLGETGAGKGVLARRIHQIASGGDAAQQAFVHVNCAALPQSLIESELFGHERGAFTDARESRAGLFEMAEGGTIFLDEIGDMSLEVQAKILTVVETGRFRRLGGQRERVTRVRVVAATNQDLSGLAARGLFRKDLLYRLNALTIRLPALRERGNDSVIIAKSVLARVASQHGRSDMELSEGAVRAILHHPWPGNVRELINSVKRAAILAEHAIIEPLDLGIQVPDHSLAWESRNGDEHISVDARNVVVTDPEALRFDFSHGPLDIDQLERRFLLEALRAAKGNVSKAARLVGLNRGALRYRIDRLQIGGATDGADDHSSNSFH